MDAKVNYNAVGTWLEPWIGWTFVVHKFNKSTCYFYMDHGNDKPSLEKHDVKLFDITP